MSNIFFTADTHFEHANIIRMAGRPFANVDEMNEALVENWNDKVSDNDTVYHLGDFAWSNEKKWFDQLRGKKRLITGNHDKNSMRLGWESISHEFRGMLDGWYFHLYHYPIYEWDQMFRKSIHLFGHVHGKPTRHEGTHFLDVGVEKTDYAPISIDEVFQRIV